MGGRNSGNGSKGVAYGRTGPYYRGVRSMGETETGGGIKTF